MYLSGYLRMSYTKITYQAYANIIDILNEKDICNKYTYRIQVVTIVSILYKYITHGNVQLIVIY